MLSLGSMAQVDRCHAEVAVAELALDDVEGHALAAELDRVRVTQLVRRRAPARTGHAQAAPQRERAGDGGQARPQREFVDDTEQWSLRRTPAAEWGTATALNYPVLPATTGAFYENFLRVLANNPCPAYTASVAGRPPGPARLLGHSSMSKR
jgi:hypothetical protein